MMTSVLGAPGSGKSALVPHLRRLLPSHVILDWDALMAPASELAQRDIVNSPTTWPAYRRLVGAVVEVIQPTPLLMLGVCTPDELDGWPIDSWILLDCDDDERRRRLEPRLGSAEIEDVLVDAARYRTLELSAIDTTGRLSDAVAADIAGFVGRTR